MSLTQRVFDLLKQQVGEAKNEKAASGVNVGQLMMLMRLLRLLRTVWGFSLE